MPGGRKSIRSVNFETSPSCVIATDSQLQNVTKFCTSPSSHCVWGIDLTFNMGKFLCHNHYVHVYSCCQERWQCATNVLWPNIYTH